ncbi:MAG: transposase, partial [Candidatus Paceibacterota bacterium]
SCLFELNDKKMIKMRSRISGRLKRKRNIGKLETCTGDTCAYIERERIVEILAFCLMPNHYHLVVHQLVENGITLFMKKLGNSYVGYFNEKHNRKGLGSLFQGPFKAVHVADNDQFLNLASYVFANPIGISDPEWKNRGVSDPERSIEFLNSYPWSSYLDSIGIKNFPSVTQREFLLNSFDDNCSAENSIKANVEGLVLRNFDSQGKLISIDDLLLED